MDEEIKTICENQGLDVASVEEIIKICISNFDDTPADQGRRTRQIQQIIQKISEEKFNNQ